MRRKLLQSDDLPGVTRAGSGTAKIQLDGDGGDDNGRSGGSEQLLRALCQELTHFLV